MLVLGFFGDAVPQALVVGNALGRLQGKAKVLRHLRRPARDDLRRRHAVERVVDFNGAELARIERQHLRRGQIGWIEAALPLRVVVAAGTNEDHLRTFAHPHISTHALPKATTRSSRLRTTGSSLRGRRDAATAWSRDAAAACLRPAPEYRTRCSPTQRARLASSAAA